jgi:hypothetical protein
MNKQNAVLLSFALLSIFMLAGSASAAVDFPANEAGISAYVKAKSSIDLNLTKSAFASIERETPDYIIGTVALALHTEEQYPHVYVSNDGWIVAYYPKDRSSGWILPWSDYAGGALSSTTLSKAAGIVATTIGGTTNGLKYYDFRYPDATKMMVILESTTSSNFFNVTIPTTFLTYAVDWSHYKASAGYWSYAYLNDVLISSIPNTGSTYGSSIGVFNNGKENKILINTQAGTAYFGMVLEYAE